MHGRLLLALALALATSLALSACGDDPVGGADVSIDGAADGEADGGVLPADATVTSADVVGVTDPFACPSGHNCVCEQHSDCLSGLCLDVGAGKRCAEPCANRACLGDRVCRRVVLSGKGGWVCVPPRVNLCNPCKASTACEAVGLEDSRCVDYGDRGAFCGAACHGDADCGEGYACLSATSVEGGTSLQCVKVDDLKLVTDCPCSVAAANAELETLCRKAGDAGAGCPGKRRCTAAGLTACTASAPEAELCDGADNDCDGQTDEDACLDGNPCTDDSCDTQVGCTNANNTAPCDADGSVCTVGDGCVAGVCEAGAAQSCDDGNPCTKDTCDSDKGCQSTPDDGASCDADGSACTAADACSAGACVAGKAKDCADSEACTLDSCDPKTGDCANVLVAALSCDDGDPCTHTDLCDDKGGCAGKALGCDDGNPCTKGACDAKVGCVSAAVADGAACDDGDLCTDVGTCSNGVCAAGKAKVCTTTKTCVASRCNGKTGQCLEFQAKIGALCDDGDACTALDSCDAKGGCAGTGANCDDANACTVDSCDKAKGGCQNVAKTGPCDDGDACTSGETCSGSGANISCQGGKTVDCDDKSACTDDSCDPSSGCVNAAKKDGTACDDGEACTKPDTCQSGKCSPGADTCSCSKDADCDDKNACTQDTCGADSKCSSTPVTDGASCDDGDPCTDKDTCKAANGTSACTAGANKSCDDDNACTDDSCDSKTGCVNAPKKDGTACDDGDDCTEDDACASGKCAGTPKSALVSTFAGNAQGYKDGKGAQAQFNIPTGVARDGAGVLFVTDLGNHRVRKIATDGTVTTFAGSALPGQVDGTGTAASFRSPTGITRDSAGNLYVLDTGNHLIRKITTAAVVTTLAGSNTPGGFGEGPKGGYADGTGAAAKFNAPSAIVFSGGALYVADTGNHRVRKVTLTGEVTTFAGSGVAGFKDATGTAAQFNSPAGIGVGASGEVVVGDTGNHRVRAIASNGAVTTIAGSGTANFKDGKGTAAQFNQPMSIAVDGLGQLLVCDSGNHRVRAIASDGTVTTYLGSGEQDIGEGELLKAKFDQPSALVTDGQGKAWIMDRGNHRVRGVNDGPKQCLIQGQSKD